MKSLRILILFSLGAFSLAACEPEVEPNSPDDYWTTTELNSRLPGKTMAVSYVGNGEVFARRYMQPKGTLIVNNVGTGERFEGKWNIRDSLICFLFRVSSNTELCYKVFEKEAQLYLEGAVNIGGINRITLQSGDTTG